MDCFVFYRTHATTHHCVTNTHTAPRRYSRKKRPPIGFTPFAEACIRHGDKVAAVYYVDKVLTGDVDKLALYKRADAWEKAVDTALRMRDGGELRKIQQECRELTLIGKIETLLKRQRL